MKKSILIGIICIMWSLTACQPNQPKLSVQTQKKEIPTEAIETEASGGEKDPSALVPDFTLETSENTSISLSDYAGKVVILNFWASWCGPCREEMPAFQKIHEELADSEDTVLLMLNQIDDYQETKETAQQYLKDNSLDFPIVYDTGEVGYTIFGLSGIPTTVVIDREGYLSDFRIGSTDYQTVMKMVEEAK